jgi:hypothetical protein
MNLRSLAAALSAVLVTALAHDAGATNCVAPTQDWSNFPSGYQCIVGVQHFIENEWGLTFPATGLGSPADGCAALGACLEWVDNLPDPSVWNRYAWGDKTPQAYDVLIFPPEGSNPYGHAAMLDHMDGSDVYVMDDNWDGNMNRSCAWAGHDGWVHDGVWAPYGFYRLKSMEPPPPDQPPNGSLDQVDCTQIGGWSQDPDDPTKEIDVDFYFDGMAGSGAQAMRILASAMRSDLCSAIGSCDHAFAFAPPVGLLDGMPHQVFAYGIDTQMGGPNALLPGSPKSFTCNAPKPPFSPSIKRHVVDPTSLSAWQLSMLTDVARFSAADVSAIPSGADLPEKPVIEQGDDGSPEVWVIDGDEKRHIQDPASLAAWKVEPSTIVKTAAATLASTKTGEDWPETPFGLMGPDGAVYVLDVPPPAPPMMTGAAGAGGAAGHATAGHGGAAAGTGGAKSSSGGVGNGGAAEMNAMAGTASTTTDPPPTLELASGSTDHESAACEVSSGSKPGSSTWIAALVLSVWTWKRRRSADRAQPRSST